VRPDLYASSYSATGTPVLGRQGGEAAPDAGNRDAGETNLYGSSYSAIGSTSSPGRQGGEAAPDAGNSDVGETRSLCIFLVLHKKKDSSDA
jgi:hypothetical protein